jgi:hypothetical protein
MTDHHLGIALDYNDSTPADYEPKYFRAVTDGSSRLSFLFSLLSLPPLLPVINVTILQRTIFHLLSIPSA